MEYMCPTCKKVYPELTPDGRCTNRDCPRRETLIEFSSAVGVIQGLCLLICDASHTMDEPAFPGGQDSKLTMVTRAIREAVVEMAQIGKPDEAFIGIIAFGAKAAFIRNKQGAPFLMSVADINAQYGEQLDEYLFSCLHSDQSDVNRKYTDMTEALQLAWSVYEEAALFDDLSRLDPRRTVQILKHKDIVTYDNRQIDMPNVRVLLYSNGLYNPQKGAPLLNPFEGAVPASPLMTAFIGDASAGEEAATGAAELLGLATVCPVHEKKGYFAIDTPEEYVELRSLFHMASGATGFCDQCLKEYVNPSIGRR